MTMELSAHNTGTGVVEVHRRNRRTGAWARTLTYGVKEARSVLALWTKMPEAINPEVNPKFLDDFAAAIELEATV